MQPLRENSIKHWCICSAGSLINDTKNCNAKLKITPPWFRGGVKKSRFCDCGIMKGRQECFVRARPRKFGHWRQQIEFPLSPFMGQFAISSPWLISCSGKWCRAFSHPSQNTVVWLPTYYSFIFTPPQNRGGVIFLLQFVCVFVCVCVCVCVCMCVCVCVYVCVFNVFLLTKFQRNGCTDLDAVFAKWLLTTLARTLLNWWAWIKGQGHGDRKCM